MTGEEIRVEKARIVARYGNWTNHNIHLGSDIFTMGKDVSTGADAKLTRILQMVVDVAGGSLEQLRVLDLACLEGLYGLEFALHGAEVVGIEGREPNIEKARFAQRALGLENIRFFHDDVRRISAAQHGTFDVVLCLGIFYHLDKCDIPDFLSRLAEVCSRYLVIDTHLALQVDDVMVLQGRQYPGQAYIEHAVDSTPEQRLASLWASLDNVRSFWPDRASFFELLTGVGFSSVYECHQPPVAKYVQMRADGQADRNTFLAIKGQSRVAHALKRDNGCSSRPVTRVTRGPS
ncbi:MAG: class I SAM-dependent methyltransferase [Pirellulales bacterium]